MLSLVATLLLLLNQDRANVGLNPLGSCQDLQSFAIQRANAQVSWNHLSHYQGDKLAIDSMLSGQHWLIGENLVGWTGTVDAKALETALMNSPKHRDNILQPRFNCISIAINGAGNVIAEEFSV